MDRIEGGCRCGSVRWRISCERLPRTYACHCLDCQTWSGSAFSQQAIVARQRFECMGQVGRFDLPSADGERISNQFACPVCFTRLYNTNSGRPGLVIVRAGTFDASHQLEVVAHIWTKRKQPWLTLDERCPAWPEGAPQTDLYRLIDVQPVVDPPRA
ncbi:GFA family protein [Sinorhizobium mexicanum]|uniref:GFA family protein n=1 Tax=Sinorhizobium mexicanum TaxID=375549 RepID=A0A859QDB5_9HYPH|nr:GFA family protein [Sinorhizobium mexicanum]QLL62122.1 GFA family protein [Sinorhizobium mexicanum]